MHDLESELRNLPLRVPSRDLDARILAQRPVRRGGDVPSRRRQRPYWILGWSLAVGVLGFFLGRLTSPEMPAPSPAPATTPTMTVIMNIPMVGNPFEVVNPPDIFETGDWIKSDISKERKKS